MAYVHAEQMGTVSQHSAQYYCFGRVTIIEQNAINNTTTFTAQLVHKHKSSAESATLRTWKGKCISRFVRIDGVKHDLADIATVDATSWGSGRVNEFILAEYTETVSHDANGNKTVDLWMGCVANSGGSGPGTCRVKSNDYSWACPLPSLDRTGMSVTLSPVITGTTSANLNRWWSGDADICHYSVDDGATWREEWGDYPDGIKLSGNDLTGLQPNTTYKVKIKVRKRSNQVWSTSDSYSITTHPNPVVLRSFTVYARDPFTIVANVSTWDAALTDHIDVACNGVTKRLTGAGGEVTFSVSPETTYTVYTTAFTVRSGAPSETWSMNATTPADKFCHIAGTNGFWSGKYKMYLINTNGVITEIKKENVRLL